MTRPGSKTQNYGKRKAPKRARRPGAASFGTSVNHKAVQKAQKLETPKDTQVKVLLDALRAAVAPSK